MFSRSIRCLASQRMMRPALLTRSFSTAPGSGGSLVIAEHNNSSLNEATNNSVTAAVEIGNPVTVLVAGKGCKAVADAAAGIKGVSKVILADNEALEHQLAENVTNVVLQAHYETGYQHIIAPATSNGKNLLPRVAVNLDVAPVSEVIAIESPETFHRPVYAGSVINTVTCPEPVKIMTIRATNFDAAEGGASGASVEEMTVGANTDEKISRHVKDELSVSDRPDLATAKTVVAGGRGLGSEENFKLVEDLADSMNGAMGASRAAVDAGYCPNDMQIGQTGKVVSPDLYVAVGISGAIQHLAGMKDSKTIVAINKDEEAPIFQVSDYGLVDDLFTAVPAMTDAAKA